MISFRCSVRPQLRRDSFPLAIGLAVLALAQAMLPGLAAGDEVEKLRSVREVIERSVPYIEREGADWIAKRDCLTCHHTSFMVWSLHAAKRKGVAVDQEKLTRWTEWATDWRNLAAPNARDKAVQEETLKSHSDTIAQLLLGRPGLDGSASSPEWFAEYATQLAKGQKEDGSWNPGGQLPGQKRPKRETQEVSTTWALLASVVSEVPLTAAQDKSRAWLGEETAGLSTEWWATRLMLERRLGRHDKADKIRIELLKSQRADGGWGWLCADDSDALGTGIALYALGSDQLTATDPAVAKAHAFLARTQGDDGSWPVRGTKEGKKDRVEPTSVFWGACWAVIGMCETIQPQ